MPITPLPAQRLNPAALTLTGGLLVGLLLALFANGTNAQTTGLASAPPTPPKTVVAQATSSPAWAELNAAQREILKPLASTWPALSQGHKRKWLQMAKSYPTLSADEQVKMQGRMKEWVALTPQQRAQARLNFAKTKELSQELSAEEKQAKWQAYQALSDEEKRKLAAKAPRRPVGAAPAAKPVAPQKLATVPARADKQKGKPAPKMAVSQPVTDQPGAAPAATTDSTPQ
ncbi:DUF3106 domain-containing protein [Polaromonas sp.]|uniref:DUF3106 domain-containing protein n=1 Tax=Polaromonas sp. TaxID=1869339 RepID=UPI0032671F6F